MLVIQHREAPTSAPRILPKGSVVTMLAHVPVRAVVLGHTGKAILVRLPQPARGGFMSGRRRASRWILRENEGLSWVQGELAPYQLAEWALLR